MSEREAKSHIDRAKDALPHLLNYQQADEDGIMVLVSRQAADEVAQGFKAACDWYGEAIEQRDEAEAEADRLRARCAQLEKALEPFAKAVEAADQRADSMGFARSFDEYQVTWTFSFGELRHARATLQGQDNGR